MLRIVAGKLHKQYTSTRNEPNIHRWHEYLNGCDNKYLTCQEAGISPGSSALCEGFDLTIFCTSSEEYSQAFWYPVCSPCQVDAIVYRLWSAFHNGHNSQPTAEPHRSACTQAWRSAKHNKVFYFSKPYRGTWQCLQCPIHCGSTC